jgi:hypothetical protein
MPLPTESPYLPFSPGGAGTRACLASRSTLDGPYPPTRWPIGDTCGQDTRVGACARPPVILRTLNQPCFNRIVPNVPPDPAHLDVVANPVLVGFPLSERVSGEPEDFISLACSSALQPAKQKGRSSLRQQQDVNVIGHQHPRPKLIVPKIDAAQQRSNYELGNRFQIQIQRTLPGRVEIPVNPDESLASGKLPRRRVSPLRQTAVQIPGSENPLSFRIPMGQPTHRPLVPFVDCYSHPMSKRRHECPGHKYPPMGHLVRGQGLANTLRLASRHECPRHL